jgi:hypothetical protein
MHQSIRNELGVMQPLTLAKSPDLGYPIRNAHHYHQPVDVYTLLEHEDQERWIQCVFFSNASAKILIITQASVFMK